jgi:NADH-quinone oxidoreductase subunit A
MAMTDYLPVLVHLAVSAGVALALLALHMLVGGRYPTPEKLMPYESGVWPFGSARERVPIRYYLIAMLFILFAVEAAFLYPWAVVLREVEPTALWAGVVFIALLALGYVYEWARGGLEWQ